MANARIEELKGLMAVIEAADTQRAAIDKEADAAFEAGDLALAERLDAQSDAMYRANDYTKAAELLATLAVCDLKTAMVMLRSGKVADLMARAA